MPHYISEIVQGSVKQEAGEILGDVQAPQGWNVGAVSCSMDSKHSFPVTFRRPTCASSLLHGWPILLHNRRIWRRPRFEYLLANCLRDGHINHMTNKSLNRNLSGRKYKISKTSKPIEKYHKSDDTTHLHWNNYSSVKDQIDLEEETFTVRNCVTKQDSKEVRKYKINCKTEKIQLIKSMNFHTETWIIIEHTMKNI